MVRFIGRVLTGILFIAVFAVLLPFIILKLLMLGLLALGFFRFIMGSRKRRYAHYKATAVPLKRKYHDVEDADVIYIK